MKYLKTLKYNFRKSVPLFALAGATLLPGCKPDLKDEEPVDPYNPGQEQPVARHTTTYVWGYQSGTHLKTEGLDKICASLDSAEVEKVNLLSNENPWDGYDVSRIKKTYILRFYDSLKQRKIPQEQINKINFTGNLHKVHIDVIDDSTWISQNHPNLKFIDAFRSRFTVQR